MRPGELLRRLQYLLLRDRFTRELEEEMRLHRELRAERLQGGGLAPVAARYAAHRKFGNTTYHQERSRDMWGLHWIDDVLTDLRFAVRRLVSRPGFAISTIMVAALGIGATTAVFSAVDAAILRPLPFFRPHELVTLPNVNVPFDASEFRRPGGGGANRYRYLDVNDLAAMPELVSSVAAFAPGGMNLEDATSPRRVKVGVVTANFFSTLGISAAKGRVFTAEEGKPRGPRVVIISDALWRTQYGGADVIGRRIPLHGNSYEIIGVMPRRFSFPAESDLWIPLSVPTTSETFAPFRGWLPSKVIARLAPGMSVEEASTRLLAKWEQVNPPPEPGKVFPLAETIAELRDAGAVVPLQDNMVGSRRKAFFILLGATGLLLLIAGANVANLLLSDGAGRRREIALREVIGATRGRVVRQLTAESLVLALGGALLGLALAPMALGLMRTLLPDAMVGTTPIRLDLRVLGFATGLALVTGTIFGLWPAFGTARVDPGEAIKSGGGHGATSGRLGFTRRVLITAEVTLTVMLLVGSGLMLKSFHRLMSQDFGMNPEQTGSLEVTFVRPGTPEVTIADELARRARVVRQVLQKLRSDPRISAAGIINDLPLRGGGGIGISITVAEGPTPKNADFPRYLIADSGYFRALRIPLLAGRLFTADDDSIGQRSAIISKTMADQYWPGSSAIGKVFYFGGDASVPYMVVGIVADVREASADGKPGPQMYFSTHERSLSSLGFVARSTLPAGELLARMTAAMREAAPTQAVYNVRMMEDAVGKSVAPRRTNTLLIAIFGALALVLSAFGVYAVVSYTVTQRAREFGIRSALGAARSDILSLVGADMAKLVAVGLAVGLAGAWALSRILASMLYEVDARDFSTYALVPLVLLVPAAIATLVPTLRAMRVSPTEVMRAE